MSFVTPVITVIVAVTLQLLGDAEPACTQEALAPSAERWKREGGGIRTLFFILLHLGQRERKN